MIRVYKSGPHARRTPLSYAALAPLFEGRIAQVDRPEAADLYVFAHILDVQEAPEALVKDWRARQVPVVILSEEPFWDTIWGKRPCERLIYVETDWGALPVHQVNFQTSDVFRFERIPYYLLTNHRFANAYAARFARNAARSVADWRADWAARPVDLSFMFERRPEPYHWVTWPEADLIGLCSWRTELAEACSFGTVERLGRSWGTGLSRFELTTDWHLDKLARLDGRARIMGALENTHQPDYVTEKLFDAFACGARPVYYAGPNHGVHRLDLPEESWINLYGLSPTEGAARLEQSLLSPAKAEAEAYAEAQARLLALVEDTGNWMGARAWLARALPEALAMVLDQAPA